MFLAIYIIFQVRKKLQKRFNPTFKQAYQWEKEELIKAKLTIHDRGLSKPWQVVSTRYGHINLYLHGDLQAKKTVIFVHGIQSNHATVVKVLHYYLSRGFCVISYDNYGWGKSRQWGRTTMGKKEAKLLKDIVSFVKPKWSTLCLHGESMGGGTIYAYLNFYGSDEFDSIIVDAGYNSFYQNVFYQARQKISWLIYFVSPFLKILFLWFSLPIKSFLSKKQLLKISNLLHIHSFNDDLVKIEHVQKFIPYLSHSYIYPHKVRHVRGAYDATDKYYQVLDHFYDRTKIKS